MLAQSGSLFTVLGTVVPSAFLLTAAATPIQLDVRIYDYAGLGPEIRVLAQEEAGRIFAHSGIETVWHQCAPMNENQSSVACDNTSLASSRVRFVKRFPLGKEFHSDTMGWTVGQFATISIAKAEQLTRYRGGVLHQVMGHAIAHELGHILLGTQAHCASGIMRPHWDLRDWENLSHGWLLFTPEQGKALRERLSGSQTKRSI